MLFWSMLETIGEESFTSYDEVYDSFDAMGLHENLLKGVYAYGLEKPSITQQRGIVPFCKGLDVIQQAQSGTCRTATFCLGILQQIDYGLPHCQALVMAPKRELVQHIANVMQALGEYLGVKFCVAIGGIIVERRSLAAGVHVVVGTPGRLFGLLRRQDVCSDYIKTFVLDEADEIFARGFKDQIYEIFQLLPPKVQVGVFSSAMSPDVLEITRNFMNKHLRILVTQLDIYGASAVLEGVDDTEEKELSQKMMRKCLHALQKKLCKCYVTSISSSM